MLLTPHVLYFASSVGRSWIDVKENQIWLYRTSNEKYAKIRVISTSAEADDTRHYPYVTCYTGICLSA
jgi:hypothetical protein